jgi:hypothetical protein
MKNKITLLVWGIFFLIPVNVFADLNIQEGMIFFSGYSGSGSGLYRCALDGSGIQKIYSTNNSGDILAVTVDMQNQKVYWTEFDSSDLKRSNFDGSQVEVIVNPAGFDVAIGAGKVYWSVADKIMKSNLDGTNQQTVFSGIEYPCSLAIDPINNQLYWTQTINRSYTTIWRSGLDGSNPQSLAAETYRAFSLAIDVENEKLFWDLFGGEAMKIQQLCLSDPVKQNIWTGPSSAPGHLDVDLITDRIYWVDQSILHSINYDGTEHRTINIGHGPYGISIAHIPEPASALIMGLGGILLTLRRRHC